MTTKHTPGPWFLDGNGKIWRRPPSELYERGGGVAGDHPVAQAFRGHSSWEQGFPVEANARLIAAAPELLEALQSALQAFESIIDEMTVGERYTNAGQYLIDAVPEARAAILKATGEQA